MPDPRVPLFQRLPELYRQRDAERDPPGQLEALLGPVELAFGRLHENIAGLYDDFFIETCADWVVPYLGDLLGTSPLAGDPWTLRADVADTIALRRRKGTVAAFERLTFDLTGWGVLALELRERLALSLHLNHLRPDVRPPGIFELPFSRAVRGGTAYVRSPATLSLLGTAGDPFARSADVRRLAGDRVPYNLPNIALFLCRLLPLTVPFATPTARGTVSTGRATPDAAFAVRFALSPNPGPIELFNTFRWDPSRRSDPDALPVPIPHARIASGMPENRSSSYVAFELQPGAPPTDEAHRVGLRFHFPDPPFATSLSAMTTRGADLCAWETILAPSLRANELVVDSQLGRFVVGVSSQAEADALIDRLRVSFTYAAVGPVGAHPIARADVPDPFPTALDPIAPLRRIVGGSGALEAALVDLEQTGQTLVVEIADSSTYEFDPTLVAGAVFEAGVSTLRLGRSLVLRAASGQRPVVRLAAPLRFRPTTVVAATPAEQPELDARLSRLTVRLEGIYWSPGAAFPTSAALIERATLAALEIHGCTLEPGGMELPNRLRTPATTALRLANGYGFVDSAELAAFRVTPSLRIYRSIVGALRVDGAYTLGVTDSAVDAGSGATTSELAIGAVADAPAWGPALTFDRVTLFGRTRVDQASGRGGIFAARLEVQDNQTGCIRQSYLSGDHDRLPAHHDCVTGAEARLELVSDVFGQSRYLQLRSTSDRRILERGPNDDAMGALGFLADAHKLANLRIRLGEFSPVGICVVPLFLT